MPRAAAPAPTISGGLLDYNNNVADSNYNGLTVTLLERLGQLFNLTANYTYSHTIDNGNFTTFINLPPNQFNYTRNAPTPTRTFATTVGGNFARRRHRTTAL